ncbi:DNA-binding response regulator, OmpR family, contains REC and winged-helix (wHTH) domain [Clostridium cavendishii DSM 21758]|uniref:Stage 0 sporulation protein A homolog n=1 Tax=Clostridium cavendishii DSM 21758 TaxID=1121302 RepID=A0A1M6CGV6_9CLOT|nr:response regulator transcription factor [Clostridium cavendishii]SHI60081.1 DNA-binding response regulator, OmpR family, contains REC and winged-helix (wHTH) domain [Clostridium cavendishii DSM 21758]
MEKILVVDDDKDIAFMLKNYLTKEGYEIEIAHDGIEGLKSVTGFMPKIILLDVMMPNMDGYTMLSKLRDFSNIPVILLTAKGEQMDKVLGFMKGCDDYVVKPFDLTELTFRIRAVLKRINSIANNKIENEDKIIIKDLEIIRDEFRVLKLGEDLKLTKKEFEILCLLASNKGRVYSTKLIYENLWGETFIENDNSILTHIRNLREKLGDNAKEGKYIKTVWGVGYKVEKDI